MADIITEIGRAVYGPDIAHRITETGRWCVRRPLVAEGYRLLGQFFPIYQEDLDLTIDLNFDPVVNASYTTCDNQWDLKKLMPQKFQDAPMMIGYLDSVSEMTNILACRVKTLTPLVDVDNCPRRYLGHLAAMIAYKMKNEKYATVDNLRQQIKTAVEMYKINGTYRVLDLAFYLIGMKVAFYDLWTRDYVTFERHTPHKHSGLPPEFGGWETEESLHTDDAYAMNETEPPGGVGDPAPWHFDGGLAFKSPHFDLVVTMNKIISFQGAYSKLFVLEYWDYFADILEEFTPINTVPHVWQELSGMCYEDQEPYSLYDGIIRTCVMNNWVVSKLQMDVEARFDADDLPLQVLLNEGYEDWSSGVPVDWTLTGAGAAITQDASKIVSGSAYSARIASAGVAATLKQNIEDTLGIGYWQGREVTYKCFVRCGAANKARIGVYDGVGTTYSAYHSGSLLGNNDGWEELSVTRTINGAASELRFFVELGTSSVANFDDGRAWDNAATHPDQQYLDQSFEAMLTNITKFKLGDGNIGATPDPTDTDLASVVYTGTVDSMVADQEKIRFKMYVPIGTELQNITELGLYVDTIPQVLIIESFFTAFDKPTGTTLELTIDVYRKQGG